MKKLLALLLCAVMLLSFAACEQKDNDKDSDRKNKTEKTEDFEETKNEASIPEETEALIPLETLPTAEPKLKMPDVVGLPLSDALALLQDFHAVENSQVFSDKAPGIVVSQSISQGVFISPDTVIFVEVSMGPEEKAPDSKFPYIEKIYWSDQPIYSGPGYHYEYVGTIEKIGAYTIVEECFDSEGELWGKLKSGIGWISLTNVRYSEGHRETDAMSACFADGYGDYFYLGSQSEYAVKIGFKAHQDLYYYLYEMDAATGLIGDELSSGALYEGEMLVAKLDFPGDASAYILSATDSERTLFYYVGISGINGSLDFHLYELLM